MLNVKKKTKTMLFCVVLFLSFFSVSALAAQSGGSSFSTDFSFSEGGGTDSGTSYSLEKSLDTIASGTAAGTTYRIIFGLLHALTAEKTPPKYFNETKTPASGTTYSASQEYKFNITWTDEMAVNTVILEFNSVNYTYNISSGFNKDGNQYQKTFTGTAAGTYNYKWYANDTNNNWNSTSSYSYIIAAAEDDGDDGGGGGGGGVDTPSTPDVPSCEGVTCADLSRTCPDGYGASCSR
ncbi:MAG: hypothetical protein ISS95_00400, partial [Candidatus Aenigmarchaeota archaeon]|nr:hypothetical protein [Candidatus Aenigmarchaeota archaeon]